MAGRPGIRTNRTKGVKVCQAPRFKQGFSRSEIKSQVKGDRKQETRRVITPGEGRYKNWPWQAWLARTTNPGQNCKITDTNPRSKREDDSTSWKVKGRTVEKKTSTKDDTSVQKGWRCEIARRNPRLRALLWPSDKKRGQLMLRWVPWGSLFCKFRKE